MDPVNCALTLQRKVMPPGSDISCSKRYQCRPDRRTTTPAQRYGSKTTMQLVTSCGYVTYARSRQRLCAVVLRSVLIAFNLTVVQVALAHPHFGPGAPGRYAELKITINDEGARYDLLLSLDYVDSLVEGEWKFRTHLNDQEEDVLTKALDGFFKNANPVTIDGIRVRPVLTELQLVKDFDQQTPSWAVSPDVHLILMHSAKGRPKRVSMVWELYPQLAALQAEEPPSYQDMWVSLWAYDRKEIILFKKGEPEVVWHAPWVTGAPKPFPTPQPAEPATFPLPALSVGLVGTCLVFLAGMRYAGVWRRVRRPVLLTGVLAMGVAFGLHNVWVVRVAVPWEGGPQPPSDEEAQRIFEALHRNIYRAFDYETESDIYDALAESVDGYLLDQIYNEVYQSLILRDQGGAVCSIRWRSSRAAPPAVGSSRRPEGWASASKLGGWSTGRFHTGVTLTF